MKGKAFFTAQLRDITNAKRAERLQAALYRISDASAAIEDMEGLYVAIHRIVGEFMYARNFYIAIRNEKEATVSFPYFVDEADAAPPEAKEAKTLTDYVLRTGEPLLASPAVFSDMVERGEVEMVGSPSVDWLGVPLKKQGRAFGVLVVQSYDPAVRFAEADREMLTFVSHQIASALERKTAEARIEHLAYHDTLTGRWRRPGATRARSRSSSWTSTASRSSTIRSATPSGTRCCRGWPSASSPRRARATPWPASAATSSRW